MNECPREYECDGCIFRGTLECPIEECSNEEDTGMCFDDIPFAEAEVTCQNCAWGEDQAPDSDWMICGKTGEAVTKKTSCWEGEKK
jgi:hypothetical protein